MRRGGGALPGGHNNDQVTNYPDPIYSSSVLRQLWASLQPPQPAPSATIPPPCLLLECRAMALGFGGYVLLFSNIAELGWIYSGSILRNLPEIFSKRDRYGVLAMYMPPNRVSPSALGLGALTYTN